VQCRFGRIYASANGLMDGTTRLHVGGERVYHLMGVSCFAERVVVSQTSVVRVPPGVPPEIAAVSACAVITGVGAAMNAVQGAPDDRWPCSAPAVSVCVRSWAQR
jgi:Zn-dependent alcohol dehydrogenase